jgi:TP901 family phage tail tape measure protein
VPIDVASLLVRIGADTGGAEAGITKVGGLLRGGGGGIALGAAAATTAIAAIGIGAIKMAGDFQAGMTQLVTGAGESEGVVKDKTGKIVGGIQMVSAGILQMAVDTGTSTTQLQAGMFMIESAGYHGAAGLNVLQAAAEGAKVGNADLGVTSDALTTILKDYPTVTNGASGAMNTLIATVSSGKTHMQDLAGAMAQILPTSSSAHVGLNDVMGAMATMTGEGVPAANAATYLRQTILALDAPSKGAQKALESVGLSSTDVASEMQKSLPDALKMITDAVGKKFPVGSAAYVAALKDIAGGSKQMQGVLDLTGTHMTDFTTNVKGVADQVTKGGKTIVGWSDVQGDFNFKLDKAKEVVETFMIKLGTGLLPIAGKLVDMFTSDVLPVLNNLTAFILTKVVPAVVSLAEWFGTHVMPVIQKVASIIISDFLPILQQVAGYIISDVVPALEGIWAIIGPKLVPIVQTVGGVLKNTLGTALNVVTGIIGHTVSAVQGIIHWFQQGGVAATAVKVVLAILGGALLGLAATSIPPLIAAMVAFATTTIPTAVTAIMTSVTAYGAQALAAGAAAAATLAAAAPFILIGAAIAAVVAVIIVIVTHWNQFVGAIKAGWQAVSGAFIAGMHWVGNALGVVIGPLQSLFGFLGKIKDFLVGAFVGAFKAVGSGIQNVFGGILDIIKAPFNLIISGINFVIGGLDKIHFTIPSWVPFVGGKGFGISIPQIPYLAQGGQIEQPGYVVVGDAGPELLHLPAGAQVAPLTHPSPAHGLPAGMQQARGMMTATAGGITIPVTLVMDNKKVAQAVIKVTPELIRNGTGTRNF